MSIKNLLKIIVTVIVSLIVFDVAGVVVSLIFDISPFRAVSSPLFYVIWFVDGVFCGLFTYNWAGMMVSRNGDEDWMEKSDADSMGRLVLICTAGVLLGLIVLFYWILWKGSVEQNYFVPDNMVLTIEFFITLMISMIFGNNLFRPSAKPQERG